MTSFCSPKNQLARPNDVNKAKLIVLQAILLLLFAGSTPSVSVSQDIKFNRDIRPILSDRCFQCHGPDDKKREADLRFDFSTEAKRDLGGYRAIVDGDPDNSELIQRIFSTDPDERMPPESSGKKLSKLEKETMRRWIQQGARFEKHWAFQRPDSPALPKVIDRSWPKNEIDFFILANLENKKVTPSREANRRTLARRLYLDLLGLLPDAELVEAFVADKSEDAYEKLVDQLLASKHFGERMGRHWLDLARYADSNGYANDGLRSIWPYRDWVIKAINNDMPFDQFTIEQLAGDLLPRPTESQKIATGFHRNTPHQTEGGSDPEQYRVERTKNRTDTTGAVWLGLTVGCAQCHSHKFDPISHEEYYQLYAFFNNADEPTLTLTASPENQAKITSIQMDIDRLNAELKTEQQKNKAKVEKNQVVKWKSVRFSRIKSLGGATLKQGDTDEILAGGKNPNQDTYELQFEAATPVTAIRLETFTDPSLPQKGPGRASNGNFVLAELKIENQGKPVRIVAATADHSQKGWNVTAAFDGRLNTGWGINVQKGKLNVNRTAMFALAKPVSGKLKIGMITYEQGSGYNIGKFRISTSPTRPKEIDSQVKEIQTLLKNKQNELKSIKNRVPRTLGMSKRAKPRDSYVQIRGDFLDRGKPVTPGTFSVLHPLTKKNLDRMDLARWIVSPANPLTPRVVANRVWQRLFGVGLVETENDFGYQGTLPSHPKLLDFLATDLVKKGWKMKRLYKKILMSATYRQASTFRRELFFKDPKNRWLGRQGRYRVEGEVVRDLALTASGLLSRKMGGPSVFPPIPPNVIGTSSANHRWPESKGEDRYRRGVYTAIYRANVYPLLSVFDGPDRDNPCTRRSKSNTPLQALTIANDAAFMEMARKFGGRIVDESNQDSATPSADERITRAFLIAFSRIPAKEELKRLREYYLSIRKLYGSDPKSTRELSGADDPELAAWIAVARVILNLDEFVTRE